MKSDHIHTHSHTPKKKNHRKQKSWFERIFSGRIILILGITFLIFGLYYSISSTDYVNQFYSKLLNFFRPSVSLDTDVKGSGFGVLILYFLPALLVLIFSTIYSNKIIKYSLPVSLIPAIYLTGIQIYFYINYFIGGYYFQNFAMASVCLFFPPLLLFISGYRQEKQLLLVLGCIYFYISSVLLAGVYSAYYLNFLFCYVILFTVIIAWFGNKIKFPFINILNSVFAIGFFSLVFLRKFVINSKPEFLIFYFIYGSLLYLVFYGVVLIQSNEKEQPVRNWMQLILGGSNLLFFFCSLAYLLLKYYTSGSLLIFVSTLLLFNVTALLLLKKYRPTAWLLPYYYSVLFLTSLLLPLIFHENRAFLFLAGLSVGLLIYADGFNHKISLWISRVTLALTICIYIFSCLYRYLPIAILSTRVVPGGALLLNGILISVIMSLVLLVTNWQQSNKKETNPTRWLNGKSYQQLIYSLLLISIFITLGWIVFALICVLSGTVIHSAIGWFISGSLFFIFLIHQYSGKSNTFKKPILYFAFLWVLVYPLFLGWNVSGENFIHSGALNPLSIVLHYLAVAFLIILSTMTVKRIYQRNHKISILKQGVQIITVIYLGLFICIEYDNITILMTSLINSSNPSFIPGINILESTKYIPYTLILWVLSSVVFAYATYKRRQYLKTFSIVLFAGTLLKLFMIDFQQLEQGGRSAVFFGVGAFFIGFALIYPKLRKNPQPLPKDRDKLRGGKRREDDFEVIK